MNSVLASKETDQVKKLTEIGRAMEICNIFGLWVGKSTHSTPRAEARGMPFDRLKAPSETERLRVGTERGFLPRFKNRRLPSTRAQAEGAPSNVSKFT
jgi:hypothetical protein